LGGDWGGQDQRLIPGHSKSAHSLGDYRGLAANGKTPQATSLWLRRLDSLSASRLAGTEDAQQPFWAPDSRSIGFFARGNLRKIDVAGGPDQTLADASFPLGGTWSPGGVIVFAPRFGAMHQVPAEGGEAVPLAQSLAGKNDTRPSFLPDGTSSSSVSPGKLGGRKPVWDRWDQRKSSRSLMRPPFTRLRDTCCLCASLR
jgi:hypothetical protein